jgi:uroporphyrin-III C-methyltransferase/precorrin-2 dehydrogenase/sirohydrochlorin ferrochelatase
VSRLYPAFLKLEGRPVLVVGGGPVAAGKLSGLLEAGARVRLVAPEVVAEAEPAGVEVVRRGFRPADLDGVFLAVAAATSAVNAEVARAAEARGVFVNAVDDVAHASVYLGGVFRRGGVTFAVSTDGQAPALAGLLREALEAVIPEDLGAWVDEARRVRARQKAEGLPMGERRPLLLQALNELYAGRTAAPQVGA